MSTFAVHCPHCGAPNEDPFEVFLQDAVDWKLCAECHRPFHFALMDCDACGDEGVFTWQAEPVDMNVGDLKCPGCGNGYCHGNETEDGFPAAS